MNRLCVNCSGEIGPSGLDALVTVADRHRERAEQLEAEVEKLRAVLRQIADWELDMEEATAAARAALASTPKEPECDCNGGGTVAGGKRIACDNEMHDASIYLDTWAKGP